MKKLLTAVLAAFVFMGSAFAIDFTADLNFKVPMDTWTEKTGPTNVPLLGEVTKYYDFFNYGLGFDLRGQAMFNKQFGFGVDFGMDFPQLENLTVRTYTKKDKSTNKDKSTPSGYPKKYSDSYDKACYTFDLFFGPIFSVKRTKAYQIYVMPGMMFEFFNGVYTSGDTTKTTSYTNIGTGVEVSAVYNVTKEFYATASCPLVWMFTHNAYVNSDAMSFYFAPKFGIGYRF